MARICELMHIAQTICDANGLVCNCFIDAGAFKETYKVSEGDKIFALKVFKPNNSSERTSREIDAMKRARCSSIAELITVDTHSSCHGEFLYMLEEYLAGGSLGRQIKTSALSKDEVVSIGMDLLKALEATHREHIVHRDIKPDNIMFRGNRKDAVLVDFGLVRDLDATSLTQAFHTRGPGTAFYSAPEQLNNEKALIDWRTDQFALGITLFEAAFLQHPFDAGSTVETIEHVASKQCCSQSAMQLITQTGLMPLAKMLEPYPIKRYRIPSDLIEEWNKLEV